MLGRHTFVCLNELQHYIAAAAATPAALSARDRQCYSRRHSIIPAATVFRILNICGLPAPIIAKIAVQIYNTHRLAVYCGGEIITKIKISVMTRVYLEKSGHHDNKMS